ncbi:MAG: hypothetical protein KPEEDBHJ_03080 [Anaerolineales bacterium]|nr:hypothetical protein [Anaerolineales bacterium]
MTEQAAYNTRAKTIFRVEKNADNPYVMIDRRLIENPNLSWKAKGLLAYLLSRPDDWVVRFRDLVNRSPDGGHVVRGAMKELKACGHVKVTQERAEGKITQWVYTIHEQPLCNFQQVEKQQVENRTLNNNKGTKKKVKQIRQKPPQPKASEFSSNVLFREVTEKYPKKANWYDVLKYINDVEKRLGRTVTKDDLIPYYSAWCANGWNEWSIRWLEYAVRGELPVYGKKEEPQKEPVLVY